MSRDREKDPSAVAGEITVDADAPERTSPVREPAPWVRTRLRTSRAAALLLALLVLGTSFLAAALPRTLDRDSDHALTGLLDKLPSSDRGLNATIVPSNSNPSGLMAFNPSSVSTAAAAIQDQLVAPLAPLRQDDSYGARSIQGRYLTDPGMPRPDTDDPKLNLFALVGEMSHVKVVQGRTPQPVRTTPDGPFLEIMLSKETADRLGVGVGSTIGASVEPSKFLGPHHTHPLKVVGLFEANDPKEAFWGTAPCLTAPCLSDDSGMPPNQYWATGALISEMNMPELLSYDSSELVWQIPVDPNHLHAYQVPAARQLLNSILSGQRAVDLRDKLDLPGLQVTSHLLDLFDQAQQDQAAAAPLYAIGPLGAGAVAVVLLALAAGLAADRRRAELLLLRARGGSLPGIGGRLLAETAVLAVPAAVLGTALALVLLPAPRSLTAILLGAVAGLAATLPFPARAVLMLHAGSPRVGRSRRPQRPTRQRRFSVARVLGDPRRLVAELAALVLAVGAVVAVRRRGVEPLGNSVDLLLSSAPLLLGLAGAVVLARIFPMLLAPAVWLARRGKGALGFVGLARATRVGGVGGGQGAGGDRETGRAPTVLPLLALVLAVTTAGFGVTMLDSADQARQTAVRQLVGGDARVFGNDETTLPPGFLPAVAKLPGVHGGTAMVLDNNTSLAASDGAMLSGALVLMVDPASYAELARSVDYGQFDPALLEQPVAGPGAPVPALITEPVAATVGTGVGSTQLPGGYGSLSFKVVGTIDGSPALPNGGPRPVLVVSSAAVAQQLPHAKDLVDAPNAWFGLGNGISSADLRKLLTSELTTSQGAGNGVGHGKVTVNDFFSIATRGDTAAGIGAGPLQRSATQLFWAAVVIAAGYSLLSLLLTLLRAAPERAALLARLRAMGLRPRQGVVLILCEALPQALAAAAAGAGIAYLSVPLLGSAVNLSPMVGTAVPGGLRIEAAAVAWQAAALAGLCTLVVLVETALTGRRQINTELRVGDQR